MPDNPVCRDEMEHPESPVVLVPRDSQFLVDPENQVLMGCLGSQDFLEHGAILANKE